MKNQIYELRTENNISQGALADKCKVSRQTINAIENNKYDPSLALAFRLAEVLGTTVDKLFCTSSRGVVVGERKDKPFRYYISCYRYVSVCTLLLVK